MDTTTYEAEAATEQTHWWFVGRRRLFGNLITKLQLPADIQILDIGSSTGTNLRMLADLGLKNVKGLDPSLTARDFCREKGLAEVIIGDARDLPFDDNSQDLILATDVIEHVDEDDLALQEACRVLKPGGHILLTVPAFHCLWGIQDDVSQHKRRYNKKPFLQLVQAAGFQVSDAFYFNYLLFLPIWFTRKLLMTFRPNIRAETDINSAVINKVLMGIFSFDIATASRLRPPFGVSLLVLAQKPAV